MGIISTLQKDYIQKSKLFLYPVLGIKRGSITPINTYMSWSSEISLLDYKLISVYHSRTDPEFKAFETTKLVGNTYFHAIEDLDDGTKAYIFDLVSISSDYDLVIDGKYSKMSAVHKQLILNHFKNGQTYNARMLTYLNPINYCSDYAALLGEPVTVKTLQRLGELCSKPDFNKENLEVKKKVIIFGENNTLKNIEL